MFVHINPEETQTIQRIPRALLVPGPGLPKGDLLLGYNDKGRCPMLVEGECSIYEYRPQTCRNYDCRIFAATGVRVDRQSQPEIARRVMEWVFDYETEESQQAHATLQEAAGFLQNKRHLFPDESLPSNPGQLAALTIRIYRLFAQITGKPDDIILDAIMTTLNEEKAARALRV